MIMNTLFSYECGRIYRIFFGNVRWRQSIAFQNVLDVVNSHQGHPFMFINTLFSYKYKCEKTSICLPIIEILILKFN